MGFSLFFFQIKDISFTSYKIKTKIFFVFFLIFLTFSAFSGEKIPLKSANPQEDRTKILLNARTYIGTPYVYGGIGRTGIDCSGLIYTVVLDTTGQAVPRSVRALYKFSKEIPISELEPGDIVFFQTGNPGIPTHAGFYLGDNQFLHSASAGSETGVIISSLDEKYWKNTFFSAGRILPSTSQPFELSKDYDTVLAESSEEDFTEEYLAHSDSTLSYSENNSSVNKEPIPNSSGIKGSSAKITSGTPYGNFSDEALKKAEQINKEALEKARNLNDEKNAKAGNWSDRAQKYLQP